MSEEYLENGKGMLNEMPDTDKEEMMKDFEVPSMDNLMKLVDSLGGVTDEDKVKLREHFLKRAADGLNPFGGDSPLGGALPSNTKPYESSSFELIVFVSMIAIIVSVFAFFGYKLYKSLVERDRKREEKLKAKQSKKKK